MRDTDERLIVTTVEGPDAALRLTLLGDVRVIAADPCAAHLHGARAATAAVMCLSHVEYLRLGGYRAGRDLDALHRRISWLLPDDAARWLRDRGTLALKPVSESAFERMKLGVTRVVLIQEPLDEVLGRLPEASVDAVILAGACGCRPEALLRHARRVSKRSGEPAVAAVSA